VTVQPPTAWPRQAYTDAQVQALIRDTAGVTKGYGCELVTRALDVTEDLGGDFLGGTVRRGSLDELHGTAVLKFQRSLAWGAALVRPYATLTGDLPDLGRTTMRFNMGVYKTDTPGHEIGPDVPVYEVECYDILTLLRDSIGDSYTVPAGANYLDTAEQILNDRGMVAYLIDPAAAALVLPSAMTWALQDDPTWLGVVNALLQAVGYGGIWTDWDGRARLAPYETPAQRVAEWVYDVGEYTSMVDPRRRIEHDFYDVPNRWVFWRANNTDDVEPVDGNGRYEFINETNGETSVAARDGWVKTHPEGLDVADHASLVAAAASKIDAHMQVATKLPWATDANPLHWHLDKLSVIDPAAGGVSDVIEHAWQYSLSTTERMTHEWTVV
jgi:hypothetical protein